MRNSTVAKLSVQSQRIAPKRRKICNASSRGNKTDKYECFLCGKAKQEAAAGTKRAVAGCERIVMDRTHQGTGKVREGTITGLTTIAALGYQEGGFVWSLT